MKVIGVGNTGSKLAYLFDENAMLFSTAEQDSNNFAKSKNVVNISKDGASKRFKTGLKIWSDNKERVSQYLNNIVDDKVIIFSGMGGGSGSSSLEVFSKDLLENNNKVLIVGVLPFVKENNPPLANAVQSVNNVLPFINDVSVILFDNEVLLKKYESDWNEVNNHIVSRIDYIINLLDKYNTDNYSPMTLDRSELESVVFGGGFLDISDTFLEDSVAKFDFAQLDKETKNCLLCIMVDEKIKNKELVDHYQTVFTKVVEAHGKKAPNARMLPGILRVSVNYSNAEDESINDRCYLTIASGLSVDKYLKKLNKIRDNAVKRASAFSEKKKASKILDKKDSKVLDV